MGGGPRSTVGTATDAGALLRALFSAIAQPHAGPPGASSFNVPSVSAEGAMTGQRGDRTIAEATTFSTTGGMRPRCGGTGAVSDLDLTELYDADKSLADGPFTIPGYTADGWYTRIFAESGLFPVDEPIRSCTKRQLHDFPYKEPTKIRIGDTNMTFEGLIPKLQRSLLAKERDAMQPHIRAFADRAVTFQPCPECGGTRLAAHARESRINGVSTADACAMQITDLADWVRSLTASAHGQQVAPLLANLTALLDAFVRMGLGYLSLDRPASALSGAESRRTRMIRHLSSALTDVTYVFDEPTIGLHPHDIETVAELLRDLRDKGNTVLVIEHEPEVIAIVDHVVDLGPMRAPMTTRSCTKAMSWVCAPRALSPVSTSIAASR